MENVEIYISAKCSDLFDMIVIENGNTIKELEGSVPYVDGLGGGDYVEMKIDIETGQILNWDKEAMCEYITKMKEFKGVKIPNNFEDLMEDEDYMNDQDKTDEERLDEMIEKYGGSEDTEKLLEENNKKYKPLFEQAQKDIQPYAEKFKDKKIEGKEVVIYKTFTGRGMSPTGMYCAMYKIMTAAKLLLENDIIFDFNPNDGFKINVGESDLEKARQTFKENGVFENNFCKVD